MLQSQFRQTVCIPCRHLRGEMSSDRKMIVVSLRMIDSEDGCVTVLDKAFGAAVWPISSTAKEHDNNAAILLGDTLGLRANLP